jgi:penicillin-binding protein 2
MRSVVIVVMMILVGIAFIIKLLTLQVFNESYKLLAESNSRRKIINYPSRGLIYDRNGVLLVSNQAVYDIMVTPREIKPFDSIEFCQILGIDMPQLRKMFDDMRRDIRSRKISTYKPSVFLKQLSSERYAQLQEKMTRFKGFFVQRRTLRKYEYPAAAHVLGYVGEVGEGILASNPYYSMGDYIGISGIESTYEEVLRGQKGVQFMMVDVHGREKGEFRGGMYDTVAIPGKSVRLSLDIELQQLGEKLMQNKTGSIVAIKPQTGEILAMVSAPTYDPSLLVGRDRTVNFPILTQDSLKPLFNRAIQAWYPPGSTFKVINALIGLQEGVVTPETRYGCHMGYSVGNFHLGCHSHASPLNLEQSIQNSCNAYYCYVFRDIIDNKKYGNVKTALNVWKDYLVKFGLGYRLGVDIANENRGLVPNSEYFDKAKGPRWTSLGIVSLAIGQGELLVTPIQMANLSAAIANEGFFYTPHIVHAIEDQVISSEFRTQHFIDIDREHFKLVKDGMEKAVWGGAGSTARRAQIQGIDICGKTGTAQNPHGKDHSIFMAFAPKENPQIAISVYVENAGFGATWAAPIASLMVEQFINGTISKERQPLVQSITEADLVYGKNK